MRRVRYYVAMSLDGYTAGPQGEYDWIPMDPTIDFAAFFKTIDTVLMGRRSFEFTRQQEQHVEMPGTRTLVFSRTLRAEDFPDVDIVSEDAAARVSALKAQSGKDIWLFGGGILFRSLLETKLVDTVEVGIIPILLGRGIPLLPETSTTVELDLTGTEALPSGIILAQYRVVQGAAA
jgi:dihydrofolate reductase